MPDKTPLTPDAEAFFTKVRADLKAVGLDTRVIGVTDEGVADHVEIHRIILDDLKRYPSPTSSTPTNYSLVDDLRLFMEQFPQARILRLRGKKPLPADRPDRDGAVPFKEWIQRDAEALAFHVETGGRLGLVLGTMLLCVFDIDKGGQNKCWEWTHVFKERGIDYFVTESSRQNRYHIYVCKADCIKQQYAWGDILGSKSYVSLYNIKNTLTGIRQLMERQK